MTWEVGIYTHQHDNRFLTGAADTRTHTQKSHTTAAFGVESVDHFESKKAQTSEIYKFHFLLNFV